MGEIDLLMKDGETVVLVEVKAVTSSRLFDPILKIGPAKRRALRRLAAMVAARYPERNVRVDAVTLAWNGRAVPTITHYENILP